MGGKRALKRLVLITVTLLILLFAACYSYYFGLSRGYINGYEYGEQVGFAQGYSAGFSQGNATGFRLGYEQGYSAGFEYGNSTGFRLGYDEGYLRGVVEGAGRGLTIRDPTYREAMNFMASDQTDKNEYVEGKYTCVDFSANFKMNAQRVGYRCGFVYIEFPEGAHALVCFNTTDMGLIFIEPQEDSLMRVDVGIRYYMDNGYLCLWNDTIVRYVIIW